MPNFQAVHDSLYQAIYAEAHICCRFYGVEQIEPIPPQQAEQDEDFDGGMEKGVFVLFEEGGHRPLLVASSGRHGSLNEAIAQCREKHTEVQKKWPTALVVVIPVIWRDDFAPVLEQHLVFRLKPYLANRA